MIDHIDYIGTELQKRGIVMDGWFFTNYILQIHIDTYSLYVE